MSMKPGESERVIGDGEFSDVDCLEDGRFQFVLTPRQVRFVNTAVHLMQCNECPLEDKCQSDENKGADYCYPVCTLMKDADMCPATEVLWEMELEAQRQRVEAQNEQR